MSLPLPLFLFAAFPVCRDKNEPASSSIAALSPCTHPNANEPASSIVLICAAVPLLTNNNVNEPASSLVPNTVSTSPVTDANLNEPDSSIRSDKGEGVRPITRKHCHVRNESSIHVLQHWNIPGHRHSSTRTSTVVGGSTNCMEFVDAQFGETHQQLLLPLDKTSLEGAKQCK